MGPKFYNFSMQREICVNIVQEGGWKKVISTFPIVKTSWEIVSIPDDGDCHQLTIIDKESLVFFFISK